MTLTPGEVVGLPDGGPATLAAVKLRMDIPVDEVDQDDRITLSVAAVNDKVRGWPCSQRAAGLAAWPDAIVLGANMLAQRLDRRRNTPDGVAGIADLSPIYVQRNDPDVAMLLNLGTQAKPAVG